MRINEFIDRVKNIGLYKEYEGRSSRYVEKVDHKLWDPGSDETLTWVVTVDLGSGRPKFEKAECFTEGSDEPVKTIKTINTLAKHFKV